MKTQLKFQKILALVSLIVGALVFVYAIIFFSGNLSGQGLMAYRSWMVGNFDGADDFLLTGQDFVSALVVISIIYILVAVTLFITSSNKRRNYYITNYISVGANIAMGAFVGLFCLIFVAILMGKFYSMDWEALEAYIADRKESHRAPFYDVSKSPLMFIIGFIVSLIVLANATAWALNLVWKIKLMKGEKALLENGLVKEVV